MDREYEDQISCVRYCSSLGSRNLYVRLPPFQVLMKWNTVVELRFPEWFLIPFSCSLLPSPPIVRDSCYQIHWWYTSEITLGRKFCYVTSYCNALSYLMVLPCFYPIFSIFPVVGHQFLLIWWCDEESKMHSDYFIVNIVSFFHMFSLHDTCTLLNFNVCKNETLGGRNARDWMSKTNSSSSVWRVFVILFCPASMCMIFIYYITRGGNFEHDTIRKWYENYY